VTKNDSRFFAPDEAVKKLRKQQKMIVLYTYKFGFINMTDIITPNDSDVAV
jgi:hypothetical protein